MNWRSVLAHLSNSIDINVHLEGKSFFLISTHHSLLMFYNVALNMQRLEKKTFNALGEIDRVDFFQIQKFIACTITCVDFNEIFFA